MALALGDLVSAFFRTGGTLKVRGLSSRFTFRLANVSAAFKSISRQREIIQTLVIALRALDDLQQHIIDQCARAETK